MKKLCSLLLAVLFAVSAAQAVAETLTLDLACATVEEMTAAKEIIEAQIKEVLEAERNSYTQITATDALLADPDGHLGEKIRFTGLVVRAAEGISSAQILVAVQGKEYAWALVTYETSDEMPMMRADDVVTVNGTFEGTAKVDGKSVLAMDAALVKLTPAGLAQAAIDQEGGFAVTPYQWSTPLFDYLALVVENETPDTVEIGCRVIFNDPSGNMVGISRQTEPAIEAGCSTVFIFWNGTPFSSYKYELLPSVERSYAGVLTAIEHSVEISGQSAVVTATNTGDRPAEMVKCIVLFLEDGKPVGYDSTYMADANYQINPGESDVKKMKANETFDDVMVFFSGRARKR